MEQMEYKDLGRFEQISSQSLSYKDNRALIFHFLYLADSYGYDVDLADLIEKYSNDFNINLSQDNEIVNVTLSMIQLREEIDQKILPFLANWRYERVSIITKLILRIGIWDLEHSRIDHAMIINGCIELGKCFSEKDAYKFINGILDEYYKAKIATNQINRNNN